MIELLNACTRIAAIIPCYLPTGDSTTIIAADGSVTILSSRVRAVLHRLARVRAIDLSALRTRIRATTERRNLEPLPLAPGLVLVPVKVRQPRVAGDTTTGYINFHAVTSVTANKNKPYQTTVTLSGKTEIPVLWTPATVNRQLALARLAATTAPAGPVLADALQATLPGYDPALLSLAVKVAELFNEIVCMKPRL